MTASTLYRATFDLQPSEGRTLVGTAMPWDHPELVRDLTGPAYLEAFASTSCDVAIRTRPIHPVFVGHEYKFVPAAEPIGAVTFARSEDGLLFEAPLSKTKRADEMLELVNDGAMRSVSVGFTPIKQRMDQHHLGRVTVRTEVALRELSLCPTGFGQYADAGVLAVRGVLGDEPTFNAIRESVQAAIERSRFGDEGARPNGCYLWVRDITAAWAVYEYEELGEDAELYRVEYAITDGEVELSDPERVEVTYAPVPDEAERSVLDDSARQRRLRLLAAGIDLP